jgi:hypothetical protein
VNDHCNCTHEPDEAPPRSMEACVIA